VYPEIRIIAANFKRAIQSLERPSLLSGCEFDLNQTLITLHVAWIQSDGTIRIINRLVRFLQIPRVDESELLIRLAVIGVCLDCVFQDVNCLRKIILLYEQSGHARGELRLAWIDVEHFPIRIQCALHLAVFLKRHSFDETCERIRFVYRLRTQREVRRWLRADRIILSADWFYGMPARNLCG
jgi:hypothetical protein